ncbi:uncharacterized protein K444DRAFT_528188, partial [Hyaloscypha bicolor E]
YILVDFKKYLENKNKYNIIVIFINYLGKRPIIIPFFKDINYFFISNKFEPEIAKEISKYLLKIIEKKTLNIIYLTR